jgi:hypothetical protein
VDTWQILIYAFGAVGGGLVGMIFTAFLYYLTGRFILKDPRSLSSVLHIVFANRFNTSPSIESTIPPVKVDPALVRFRKRFEEINPMNLTPVAVAEKQHIPFQTLAEPSPVTLKVEQRPVPVQKLEEPVLATRIAREQQVAVNICAEPDRTTPEGDNHFEQIMPELLTEIEHNFRIAREFSGGDLISLRTEIWDNSQHAIKTLPVRLQNELVNLYGVIKMLNNVVWFSTEFQRHSSSLSEQYTKLLSTVADRLNALTGNPLLQPL